MSQVVGEAVIELRGDVERLRRDAADAGPAAGSSAGKGFMGTFGKAIAGVGALLGGAFAAGEVASLFGDALDASAGISKLKAQLGTTKAESARIGKAAGDLFGQGYGTGMEQVQEAVGAVVRDIDGMRGASEGVLERISGKVANTANIFDQDLGGVTRAVSQLMRTGLASSADEALDIITKGFQNGADKSGDFLDTLNEYGTQFRNLGLSGKEATGIISQGLQAGARDGDVVADAMKEFAIRATDGSDASQVAFEQLGLSASKMTAQIAAGGPGARKGLDTVLDRLRGMKDPVARSAAAVGLFGTQAEDMGRALFAIDPSKATDALGKVKGAADKAGDAFNDNAKARITTFFRGLQAEAIDVIGNQLIPALEGIMPVVEQLASAFLGVTGFMVEHKAITATLVGVYLTVTAAMIAYRVQQAASLLMLKLHTVGTIENTVVTRAAAVAARVWAAGQWVLNAAMSANPIGLVVIAIVALVAAFVLAWRNSETFRRVLTAAFMAVRGVIANVIGWARGFIVGAWGFIVGAVRAYVTAYRAVIVAAFTVVRVIVTTVINFVRNLMTSAWRAISSAVKSATSAVRSAVSSAFSAVRSAVSSAMSSVRSLVTAAWSAVRSATATAISNVVATVRTLPGKILAIGGAMLSAGRNIGGNIIEGIMSGLRGAAGYVGDLVGSIRSAINSALHLPFTIHGPGPLPDFTVPSFAAGTLSAPGGVAEVGEHGRELVYLPRGSRVLKASETAGRPSPGGSRSLVQNIYLPTGDPEAAAAAAASRWVLAGL